MIYRDDDITSDLWPFPFWPSVVLVILAIAVIIDVLVLTS